LHRFRDSVLYIPLESLHSQADTITYVFKKDGINTTKQEVMVGATNANNAIILGGIDVSDKIYLSIPPGLEEQKIQLLPQMEGKRGKKEEEAASAAKILSQATSN
jgi:HlyD family secretion protein